jgi:hypothetical protein
MGLQLLRDMEESYRQRLEVELEALEGKDAAANGGGTAAEGAGTLLACPVLLWLTHCIASCLA